MKESIVSVGVGVGMGVGVEWALVLASMIITSPDAWEWARFIHFHQPSVEMCSGGISGCWNVYERASSLKITSVAVHLAFKRFVGARSGRK